MSAKVSVTDIIHTVTHDERGKRKSALLLYSFFFAGVILILQAVVFSLLLGVLDASTSSFPVAVQNAVETLVPSLISTGLLLLLNSLLKEKRLVLSGYLWLLGLAVFAILSILILLKDDRETQEIAFRYLTGILLVPALLGTLLAWLQMHLNSRRNRT